MIVNLSETPMLTLWGIGAIYGNVQPVGPGVCGDLSVIGSGAGCSVMSPSVMLGVIGFGVQCAVMSIEAAVGMIPTDIEEGEYQ